MAKKKKHNKKKKRSEFRKKNSSSLRAEIMDIFRNNPSKIFNYKQIASRLHISNSETRKRIFQYINELADLEMLTHKSHGKFQLHSSQVAVLSGTIDFTKNGSAYVIIPNFKEDIYISEGNTGFALQGDEVEVILIGGKKGKLEGKVQSVLKREADQYVGVIEINEHSAFVVPTNPRIHVDFYIDKSKLKNAKNGQKVVVELIDWTDPEKSPFAKVVSVLGDAGIHEVEMHAILVEFGLPFEFPDHVLNEADKIPTTIEEKEILKRRDFREITTFTIDPADAKDFDDALSFRQLTEETFEVGIHIADVSHYVKPGSVIDKEAFKRSTSVYLVDRVVPMLPEVLSNDICSLRPNEDRLCMSVVFEMDIWGKIKNEWVGKTVIKSNKRYAYEEVQAIIEGADDEFSKEILLLNKWAQRMRLKRFKEGALEFSSTEVKFTLDETGKPTGVYHKIMKEANFLIEEFMLLANRKIARRVGVVKKPNTPKPFVYRVHDLPDPDKLLTLKEFLGRIGYKLQSTRPENASKALNLLMQEIKDSPEEETIKQMAIRTMAKAIYTTENIGHYGLAFDYYTHFTSPIRRYSDILVHRLITAYAEGKTYSNIEELESMSLHISNMEKKAIDAERASIKYKQVEFMLDKIGEQFTGNISGLTRWGIYVELEDTKIEGMIPLNSLTDDTYRFDERQNIIVGIHGGDIFEFGDRLRVQVNGADIILKQLDFRLVKPN